MSEGNQNSNQAPAPVNAKITKSKTIRTKLVGDEFLNFHNIAGRVVFEEKMTERASDEELIKLGLYLLRKEVERRLGSGEQFISASSLKND